jgi:hypothetical protein
VQKSRTKWHFLSLHARAEQGDAKNLKMVDFLAVEDSRRKLQGIFNGWREVPLKIKASSQEVEADRHL